MNWTYLTVCKSSHAAIRERWLGLLAREPAWGRLESEEKLTEAVDEVLSGLWSTLGTSDESLMRHRSPPLDIPAWSVGACRLDPTLAFLATGKRAVQVVMHRADATQSDLPRDERSVQWAELMLAFDVVSQREIQRICGVCMKRGQCTLGDGLHPFERRENPWSAPAPRA